MRSGGRLGQSEGMYPCRQASGVPSSIPDFSTGRAMRSIPRWRLAPLQPEGLRSKTEGLDHGAYENAECGYRVEACGLSGPGADRQGHVGHARHAWRRYAGGQDRAPGGRARVAPGCHRPRRRRCMRCIITRSMWRCCRFRRGLKASGSPGEGGRASSTFRWPGFQKWSGVPPRLPARGREQCPRHPWLCGPVGRSGGWLFESAGYQ